MIRTLMRAKAEAALGSDVPVYPVHLPEGPCYPSVTFQLISADSMEHLQGRSDLARARIQFDVWDPDAGRCWGKAQTLRNALDGLKDGDIRDCWMATESDSYEEGVEAFRITQDYQIIYWRTP